MDEAWKDILGYEGFYQISNLGRIKSLPRYRKNGKTSGKYLQRGIIRKNYDSKTYSCINLSKEGKTKTHFIHILVANAFLDKIEGKNYVNHIDGNKHNNNVNNLEWCTASENQRHALATGLRNKNANSIKIIQYDLSGNVIKIWESLMEASRQNNISEGAISNCINKRNKTAGGFRWEKYQK